MMEEPEIEVSGLGSSLMWGGSHSYDVPAGSSHMPEAHTHRGGNSNSITSRGADKDGPRLYISSSVKPAGASSSPSATVTMVRLIHRPIYSPFHLSQANPLLQDQAIAEIQRLVQRTYHLLTSKAAQRTYLTTILLTSAATVLYGLAAFAYILVYNTYLPDQVTALPVHLHYGIGPNPWAVVPVRNMKEYQPYDISLTLELPASPSNLDRGNFMVGIWLLDKEGTGIGASSRDENAANLVGIDGDEHALWTIPTILPEPNPAEVLASRAVLHAASRPALAPYTDPLVSLASRVLFLPGSVLFPRSSTVSLTIPLIERLSFPNAGSVSIPGHDLPPLRGPKPVPSAVFLEIQAGQSLRISSAQLTITAQLSGIRWLMYNYRLASFLLGTSAFWGCEVVFMTLAYTLLSLFVFSGPPSTSDKGKLSWPEQKRVKQEEEMSDTERTFPTTRNQPPLRYESSSGVGVKSERREGEGVAMSELPLAPGMVADDEDEDDEDTAGWRDSGIGTSYSDAGTAGSGVRKRGIGRR